MFCRVIFSLSVWLLPVVHKFHPVHVVYQRKTLETSIIQCAHMAIKNLCEARNHAVFVIEICWLPQNRNKVSSRKKKCAEKKSSSNKKGHQSTQKQKLWWYVCNGGVEIVVSSTLKVPSSEENRWRSAWNNIIIEWR